MAEPKKVYKALIERDGELVSLWARGKINKVGALWGIELTYAEGEITYAPENTNGIYVCSTLGEAKGQKINGIKKIDDGGIFVIHEAIPLGKENIPDIDMLSYPAIILGKEIYRDCPKIVPKFKPGDRVRSKNSKVVYTIRGSFIKGNIVQYSLENALGFAHEYILEPVKQVEKWVDVTKDCKFNLEILPRGYCVELNYKGQWVMEFGADKTRKQEADFLLKCDLKIETSKGTALEHFKILHKELVDE